MACREFVCAPEAVREELQRVLNCRSFDASERNRRFLKHVVEETLEGRADRIKAYSIATSVFGRSDNFDPQQDAIVRIEAGRIRRSLEHYYLTAGMSDPIRITIPVGSYVPTFSENVGGASFPSPATARPAATRGAHLAHRPSVYVDDFETEGGMGDIECFSRGFTRHLSVSLARFTDLTVIGAIGSRVPSPSIGTVRAEHGADFLLTGAISHSTAKLCIEALLIDARNGRYVWTDYIERNLGSQNIIEARTEIADGMSSALGQSCGVIMSYLANEATTSADPESEAFESVLRFHTYWRTFDREQFEPVRQALEKAIVTDPHYSEAFACLSQMYSNSMRFRYMGIATPILPLRRATTLAQRAIQLSPSSSRAYLALAIAYWFSGQISSAVEALETSMSLNPNDMEVAAELGLRHILRANWDPGVDLIQEAYRRNPALPTTYRIGLSIWHFASGRFEEALSEAWKIDMPDMIYPSIMIAISAAKLGRTKDADAALNHLLTLYPDYGCDVVSDLTGRNLDPTIVELVLHGLREAGMPCGDRSKPRAVSVNRLSQKAE